MFSSYLLPIGADPLPGAETGAHKYGFYAREDHAIMALIGMGTLHLFAAGFIATFVKAMAQVFLVEVPGVDNFSSAFFSGIGAMLAAGIAHYVLASHKVELTFLDFFKLEFRQRYRGWGWGFLAVLLFWTAGLLGSFAAAWTTYAFQLDNAITHAGTPIISLNRTRAFFAEFIGATFLTWIHLVMVGRVYNAKQHHRHLFGALIEGGLEALFIFFAYPYSRGSFTLGFWLSTASISDFFQPNYWIYLVAPIAGAGLGFLLDLVTTANWKDKDKREKRNADMSKPKGV
jgi:Major intrinsic protein